MFSSEHLPTVDRATLLPLAQAATDCPNLHIDMWQTTLLSQQGRRRIIRYAGDLPAKQRPFGIKRHFDRPTTIFGLIW